MENQEKLFYLVSRHGNCGSNVMFHNLNGRGYGTDLNNLHVFTREEAQEELDHNIKSLPLLKSEVDKLLIKAVDCQHLNSDLNIEDPNNKYVVQFKGCWNGNDIGFVVMGGKTFNYNDAAIFNHDQAEAISKNDDNLEIWSKAYLDTICRSTFQEENINTRKMITGAGIKYKKPRKPRPTSGKSRGNCPVCGVLTWDYDPHINALCKKDTCETKARDNSGYY